MNWVGWTVLGTGILVAGGASLVAFGSSRWARETQAQVALLDAARVPAPAGQNKLYDARELDGLPAPVQRYFRAVLKDGQPLIATATFKLAGTINMSDTGENWKPFTSWQRAVVHRLPAHALAGQQRGGVPRHFGEVAHQFAAGHFAVALHLRD